MAPSRAHRIAFKRFSRRNPPEAGNGRGPRTESSGIHCPSGGCAKQGSIRESPFGIATLLGDPSRDEIPRKRETGGTSGSGRPRTFPIMFPLFLILVSPQEGRTHEVAPGNAAERWAIRGYAVEGDVHGAAVRKLRPTRECAAYPPKNPRSIAFVGATETLGVWGPRVLKLERGKEGAGYEAEHE